MDDRDRQFRPITIVVVMVVVAAAWFWFTRPEVTQAMDETVDVFVPDAQTLERRTGAIDEARRLVDEINTR